MQSRNLNPPWTKEDDERLKSFVARGYSTVRASAALKRSIARVRNQARKIGCPFPPLRIARQKWAAPDQLQGQPARVPNVAPPSPMRSGG
jgi:hypothetical protein